MAESPGGTSIYKDRANDARIQLSAAILAADGKRRPVSVRFANSHHVRERYSNTHTILGITDVWLVPSEAPISTCGVWQFDAPIQLAEGESLEIKIQGNVAQHLRCSVSPLIPMDLREPNAWQKDLAAFPRANRGGEVDSFVARQWLLTGSSNDAARGNVLQLERQIVECRDGQSPVQVSQSIEPIVTRILPRGNWQDESGDIVSPHVPTFLPQAGLPTDRRLTRLDLAHWLTSPDNPLTARVQMNRLWKHFFGTGLSPVLDDLGMQGQYPAHPEVLDWLAVEFRDSGWDFKHMARLIVMSQAYRRSSVPTSSAEELDPKNLLVSHQNPRRLDAELVRDNALAVAGLLNLDMGGPPVFPYQPAHYYENLQFPNRRYVADTDDRQYRRGVYMHWQRTFLHPMLTAFDAPTREECTAMRTVANTPLQALVLLNDPTFVEAGKHLALHVQAAGLDSDADRIDWLFWQVLSPPPNPTKQNHCSRLWRASVANLPMTPIRRVPC